MSKGNPKPAKASGEVRERNLSHLWRENQIVAFVISDLHLRIDAPSARAEKGDRWLPVLKRYFDQVKKAVVSARMSSTKDDHPIVLCAGDIFHDGWRDRNCPPELVNFAMDNIPHCYAVPGQHDLPHHRLDDINKSGYWVLHKSNRIEHISANTMIQTPWVHGLQVHGFSWGETLRKPGWPKKKNLHSAALMHRYVWKDGHVHPGAADKDNVHVVQSDLERLGYDIGIAGDNHSGFVDENFLVPGAFYRSRADEVDYKPAIGAIYEDGSIVRYFLDVSNDEFVNDEELAVLLTGKGTDTMELVEALRKYKKVSSDFFELVEFYAKKQRASETVKQIITDIKDKAGDK